jgi:TolB-like protein
MTTQEAEQPNLKLYSHSIKVEDTREGVRFTVHVWANDRDTAIDEVFGLYDDAMKRASDMHIPMAGSK